MASALFIVDMKGKPLIQRIYRGDVPTTVIDYFAQRVIDEDEGNIKPVFEHNGVTFAYIRHNNVYFVVVSRLNGNISMLVVYLYRIIEVFNGYFDKVEEESVRDNFVMIYELLDEMMDFGYPQFTETGVLKEYITQQGYRLNLNMLDEDDMQSNPNKAAAPTDTITGQGGITWRKPGIKYRKNEVFLDVVESVNLLVNSNGETLHTEIQGVLKMRTHLSGMPELKLGLNDKLLLESLGKRTKGKTVDLEDIKFHQCVKLNRFESNRTISFIPPDGEFDLMSYRLNTKVKPMISVETQVEKHGTSRIEYMVKILSQFKKSSVANGVEIIVPVPNDADTPTFKTSTGSARYAPERDAFVWTIKALPGGREYLMRASFGLPSIRASDVGEGVTTNAKRPILVKFEIPYFTVSGFQVRYLKVVERSGYEALPWVRYITQSGDYQIRMN
jgi:AP-1 complex subunit mu